MRDVGVRALKRVLISGFLLSSILVISGCNNGSDSYQGYVEGRYTYMSSQVGGEIESVDVSRGSQVKKGDLLFVLKQQPEKDEVDAAKQQLKVQQQLLSDYEKGARDPIIQAKKAQIAAAEAQLVYAQKTLTRHEDLFRKKAVDRDAVDRAIRDSDQAQQRVDQLKNDLAEALSARRVNQIKAQKARVQEALANLGKLEWRLSQKKVFAPIDGLVFDDFFRKGEVVAANQPVISLLAPTDEKVIFFVPEPIRNKIKLNEFISFTCDSCKQKYKANVSFISPDAEYTPPVIFSRERRSELVYRIEARLSPEVARLLAVGQPVDVYLDGHAK